MGKTRFVHDTVFRYFPGLLLTWLLGECLFLSMTASGDVVTQPAYTFNKEGNLLSLEFSPDGRYLLYLSVNKVYVYDLEEKKFILQMDHGQSASQAFFSPNQRQIAVVGNENTKIYDLVDGSYFWLSGEFGTGRFSLDGRQLFLGTNPTAGYLYIYDTFTWNLLSFSQVTNYSTFSISFSPDLSQYAISPFHPWSYRDSDRPIPEIQLYDYQTRELIRVLNKGNKGETRDAVFDREGKYLISGGTDRKIKYWDLATGELPRELLMEKPIWDLAVSQNNQYLVVGDENTTAHLMDFKTGVNLRTFRYKKTEVGIYVDIASNGKYVATGAWEGKTVDLWDIHAPGESETPTETPIATPRATPTPWQTPIPVATPTNTPTLRAADNQYTVGELYGPDDPGNFLDCAFLPDGKRFVTLDSKTRIIVWDQESKEILHVLQTDILFPERLCITQNGHHVWTGGQDNDKFKLWGFDLDSGAVLCNMFVNLDHTAWDIMPDDSFALLGIYNEGFVKLDLTTGNIIQSFKNDELPYVPALKISPQGDMAIIGEWEGYSSTSSARNTQGALWDVKSGEVIHSFPYSNGRRITHVYWSNDERYVYLYTWANSADGGLGDIYLDQFEVESGAQVSRLLVKGENSIALSPDGTQVLQMYFFESKARPSRYPVDLTNYFTGETMQTFLHTHYATSMSFSPDGSQILIGTSGNQTETAQVYLWSIADIPPVTVPTLVPFTPTPTLTPTPTPTPDEPRPQTDEFTLREETAGISQFAFHPQTGDLVLARNTINLNKRYSPVFTTLPPATFNIDMSQYPADIWNDPSYIIADFFSDMAITADGIIYLIGRQLFEFNPENKSNPVRKWEIIGAALHAVTEQDRIPHTKIGDLLILRTGLTDNADFKTEGYLGRTISELVVFDPASGTILPDPVVSSKQFPRGMPIVDMGIGPENRLFFISRDFSKIFYLDQDGSLKEYFHFMVPLTPISFCFVPFDQSFIINTQYELWRLSSLDDSMTFLSKAKSYGKTRVSPRDEQTVYFTHFRGGDAKLVLYSLKLNDPSGTPTPTPVTETPIATPTPTPIPAWFVLDGFGGIHSSNPDIRPPVLPYFPDFNIVRDIEPDPQGKGWYMLDGYGGIHRSNPDLPVPDGLPYFGFDIARNLEITVDEKGYHFYMLDGYGAVHASGGETFPFGFLPWIVKDTMRELEPDPNGKGWLVMDEKGFIYSSTMPFMDSIRIAWSGALSPVMRGFVRFPDERTVMIDFWGGRHTNPYLPAVDKGDGVLDALYFPGWDIIWDIEAVPQASRPAN